MKKPARRASCGTSRRILSPVEGAYVFSLDSSFGFVCVADLGALQLDIIVNGRSVHSGLSHLGVNAVEHAVPVLQSLMDLKEKVERRKSAIGVHPDTGLAFMQARLNINKIDGGIKANIVPDRCVITVDRRLIPEESLAEAEREILSCLTGTGVDCQIGSRFSIPTVPPCEDPIVDELASAILGVTGATGRFGEMGSGDLSNIVVNDWRGKSFGSGVIRPECRIHGNDEFVYVKDVHALSAIIATFLS